METDKPAASRGFARRIVRFLVARYYPRIEITGGEHIPQTGPVLLCGNHANSLFDPVIIGIAARRPVRFMAKAPLFEAPVLGPIMNALGMIPAYRGSDDSKQVRKNLESLDVGAKILLDGEAMGIFPEGKSHDAAHVEMVRSGAARIALQAAAEGAKGVQVVPLGLNYEGKENFRSAVWVAVGEPIDVDEWLQKHDGNERVARRALTSELEERLKQVVIHLDEPKWEPFLGDLEVLVPERNAASASKVEPIRQRKRIVDAMNHFLSTDRPRAEETADSITGYRNQVHQAGIRVDSPVLHSRGLSMVLTLLWQAFWIVLLLFPALAGTLFHVVPFTLVRLAASAVRQKLKQSSRTTTSLWRFSLGLPVYALWYAAAGWWLVFEFQATTWFVCTTLISMPFLGALALEYWRGARTVGSLWWHQVRFIFRRGRLNELRGMQQELRQKMGELAAEYEKVSPRVEQPAGGGA